MGRSAARLIEFRKPGLARVRGIPYQFIPIPQNFQAFWIQRLTRPQILVYQYVCMRTLGFRKTSDAISLAQFISGVQTKDGKWIDRGTGYSRRTVLRAISDLEKRGLLNRIIRHGRPTIYEPLAPLPFDYADRCQ